MKNELMRLLVIVAVLVALVMVLHIQTGIAVIVPVITFLSDIIHRAWAEASREKKTDRSAKSDEPEG